MADRNNHQARRRWRIDVYAILLIMMGAALAIVASFMMDVPLGWLALGLFFITLGVLLGLG